MEIKENPLYTIYGLKSKTIKNGKLVNKFTNEDFEVFLNRNHFLQISTPLYR